MKTPVRILQTLALAFAGQVILVADDPPAVPEPPPAPEAIAETVTLAVQQATDAAARAQAQVQRELERAHRAVVIAQARHAGDEIDLEIEAPEPPEPPDPFGAIAGFGGSGGFSWTGEFPGASTPPLVIPAGTPEPANLTEAQEDLSILSRILSKAATRVGGGGEDPMALGIMIRSFPGLRSPQALQIEGFGAVFLLNVSFPLAAPAVPADTRTEKPANTTWEQTRRELYGPRRGSPDVLILKHTGDRKPVAYDPERVERLQRDLVEALKNAANLRHLKADEQIVAVVSGQGGGERGARVVRAEVRRSTGDARPRTETRETTLTGEGGGAGGSTLVLRVKKSDATEYAAGTIGPDEFRKRVAVSTY